MYSTEKLDKDYILRRISEQDIMEKYLGVSVQFSSYFTSPLRSDKTPTCCFYIDRRGILILRDYAGYFHGDCFNVVEKLYGESYKEALRRIASDFGLRGTVESKERISLQAKSSPSLPRVISIKRQKWTTRDISYWKSYGIKSSTLSYFHVSSISHAWLENTLFYAYSLVDIGYAYYLAPGKYKLYFPLRSSYRFVSNTSLIQGYNQLPLSGEYLVITKSLKDVMLLYQYGIPAIAPGGESNNLDSSLIDSLKFRFRRIYTLYDFDYAGVKGALKIRRVYQIQPLFLTNGRFGSISYYAKDLSDFHKRYGEDNLTSLLHQTIQWLIQSESSQLNS